MFSVQIERREKKLYLYLDGAVDEDSKLPKLDAANVTEINIDLENIKAINSVGIRSWMQWLEPLPKNVPIVFHNAKQNLLLQFSTVYGFFPPQAKLASCHLPMYCNAYDYSFSVFVKVEAGR